MAKDYATSFYNSGAWKKTQAAYMMSQHYVCERCGNVARIVHHIRYLTPKNISDPKMTLGWDNLEALCQECHNNEHFRASACAPGLMFNHNGELVPTWK